MNPDPIIQAGLKSAPLVALIGNRYALAQLPANTAYPAIVYTIVDTVPEPNVNPFAGARLHRARVQFNPLALSMGAVKELHTALITAMDYIHNETVGGKLVMSCRVGMAGPASKDNDAGVYTQPLDFILRYYA